MPFERASVIVDLLPASLLPNRAQLLARAKQSGRQVVDMHQADVASAALQNTSPLLQELSAAKTPEAAAREDAQAAGAAAADADSQLVAARAELQAVRKAHDDLEIVAEANSGAVTSLSAEVKSLKLQLVAAKRATAKAADAQKSAAAQRENQLAAAATRAAAAHEELLAEARAVAAWDAAAAQAAAEELQQQLSGTIATQVLYLMSTALRPRPSECMDSRGAAIKLAK